MGTEHINGLRGIQLGDEDLLYGRRYTGHMLCERKGSGLLIGEWVNKTERFSRLLEELAEHPLVKGTWWVDSPLPAADHAVIDDKAVALSCPWLLLRELIKSICHLLLRPAA